MNYSGNQDYEREREELAGTQRIIDFDPSAETNSLLGGDGSKIRLIPEPTDSPNDPLNWPLWRKVWHSTLVLYVTALTAAISNDAGAGGEKIEEKLKISYGVQNTAAGALFIAIGTWTFLASGMPHIYGRRLQYLICLLSGLGGSIWYARIETIGDTIGCQVFVGASEACAEALVQLSLSDLFFQHQRGGVLGVYILATSIGTFLGPLTAGYIAANNWRWVGWTAAIVCASSLILFYFTLEETAFHREAFVGTLRAREVGFPSTAGDEEKKTTDDHTHRGTSPSNSLSNATADRPKTYWQRIALVTFAPDVIGTGLKQYFIQLLHTTRVFTFPAVIYSGLQWGMQDALLSFYLTVQEDNWYEAPWYYTDAEVSIMNVPTLIGALIGCVYGGWFSDVFVRWIAKRPGRNGISEAEDRLWLLLPSAFINPAGLMLFGIASDKGWDWPWPYVGLGLVGFGWGCAGDLSMAYLMDAYPDMILEGMVGVAVINNYIACVFTFVTSIWISASGLTNTFVAMGVLAFFTQILTVPMMYWGKACRRWTAGQYKRYLYLRDGR